MACVHCGQVHDAYAVTCPVTGARLAAATFTYVNEDELLVGNVIEQRYRVQSIIGQGTTATVFSVENVRLGRPLAMKVLRPRYLGFDQVQRVYDEARAAWAIPHPCLAEVVDAGTLADGAPFIVMERYEGETLAHRISREKLSLAAAVDLLMQILSAMEALHARGVLARDPRPQNVFLAHRRGCRPVVKLLDVGLSRLLPLEKVSEQWESTRAAAGNHPQRDAGAITAPYYLSPERTRGETNITPASDLFVAMTMFYEALAIVRPFAGVTWSGLLLNIAQSSPLPLSEVRPDVPPALDALVLRTLSPDPDARPASARALQDELRAIFEGKHSTGDDEKAHAPPPAGGEPVPMTRLKPLSHTDVRVQPAPEPPPTRSSSHVAMSPSLVPSTAPSEAHARDTTLASATPSQVANAISDAIASAVGNLAATLPLSGVPNVSLPSDDDEEDERTRTDQRIGDLAVAAGAASPPAEAEEADEASAEHPYRTAPPPRAALDAAGPPTSRGTQLAKDEKDETETMELTPEVRDRIAMMMKSGATAGRDATMDVVSGDVALEEESLDEPTHIVAAAPTNTPAPTPTERPEHKRR